MIERMQTPGRQLVGVHTHRLTMDADRVRKRFGFRALSAC